MTTDTPGPIGPGTILGGKYRLTRRIGQGAMGAVWAAVNHDTSRQVAIKLILGSEPELRQRLMREAKSCGSLKHPNVIDIYDVAQTAKGEPFLVMELLSGETLSQLLNRKRRLDPMEAARIALAVARALEAAHARGIVHRDLKPANIFLHGEPSGGEPVVKVLDFGVAKNISTDDGLKTSLGNLVGSPAYMSPEQARADSSIDHRSDLWSLGILLFQMLAGVRPFLGESHLLLSKIIKGPIPTLAESVRDADPQLSEIIARCLKRDRNHRFRSATEIAELLEPIASGRAAGGASALAAGRARFPSNPDIGGQPGGVGQGGIASVIINLPATPPSSARGESDAVTARLEPRMVASLVRGPASPAPQPLGARGVIEVSEFAVTAIMGPSQARQWTATPGRDSTQKLLPSGGSASPGGTIKTDELDTERLRARLDTGESSTAPLNRPRESAPDSIDATTHVLLEREGSSPKDRRRERLALAGAILGVICLALTIVYVLLVRGVAAPQEVGTQGPQAPDVAVNELSLTATPMAVPEVKTAALDAPPTEAATNRPIASSAPSASARATAKGTLTANDIYGAQNASTATPRNDDFYFKEQGGPCAGKKFIERQRCLDELQNKAADPY